MRTETAAGLVVMVWSGVMWRFPQVLITPIAWFYEMFALSDEAAKRLDDLLHADLFVAVVRVLAIPCFLGGVALLLQ